MRNLGAFLIWGKRAKIHFIPQPRFRGSSSAQRRWFQTLSVASAHGHGKRAYRSNQRRTRAVEWRRNDPSRCQQRPLRPAVAVNRGLPTVGHRRGGVLSAMGFFYPCIPSRRRLWIRLSLVAGAATALQNGRPRFRAFGQESRQRHAIVWLDSSFLRMDSIQSELKHAAWTQ